MAETNYEHYKDELIQSFLIDNQTTCKKMLILKNGCENCNTLKCSECENSLREWLNKEYKEMSDTKTIDWENIEPGTTVYVDTDLLEGDFVNKFTTGKFLLWDRLYVYIDPIWFVYNPNGIGNHRQLIKLSVSEANEYVKLNKEDI